MIGGLVSGLISTTKAFRWLMVDVGRCCVDNRSLPLASRLASAAIHAQLLRTLGLNPAHTQPRSRHK